MYRERGVEGKREVEREIASCKGREKDGEEE